jgi:hypothetical protein
VDACALEGVALSAPKEADISNEGLLAGKRKFRFESTIAAWRAKTASRAIRLRNPDLEAAVAGINLIGNLPLTLFTVLAAVQFDI